MTGYREHSFDPNAYQDPGRPMRPFNWVQWTGVVLGVVGLAVELVYFAGRLGWIEPLFARSPNMFALLIVGIVLINSRREPPHDVAPELASERRRWLLIIVAACAVIIGVAVVVDSLVTA